MGGGTVASRAGSPGGVSLRAKGRGGQGGRGRSGPRRRRRPEGGVRVEDGTGAAVPRLCGSLASPVIP